MALEETDPEVSQIIIAEEARQRETLEMIASENHVSSAVLEAMGTVLTDKYSEGYPGRRWYCGNVHADSIEQLAIDRARELFGCEYANVQPHSGTNANIAVYLAALKPGDKLMGMSLAHGGHLSHGKDINLSGIHYQVCHYGVREDTETFDFDQIRDLVRKERPKLLIVGASAYPRTIDFAAFREIADEVGAMMMSDIAHIAGLIVGGVHPDPVPHSDFVTATTHKTLRGPRGGLILATEKWAQALDRAVFPGIQGGPLMHVIAGKAVALREAMTDEFKQYARDIITNAQALADSLIELGWRLVSGGTDNHLLLVDLRSKRPDLTGKTGALWLESADIIANHNCIPFDPRPPVTTSGVRLGTPALTTRGMGVDEMKQIATWIDRVLTSEGDREVIETIRESVSELCRRFPPPNNNKD